MSRPIKCRRICFMPGVTYYKPAGIPLNMLEENCLSFEEIEAVRLRDIKHLEQIKCAEEMNISRPTFQRILTSARGKIADSLLAGKALRINGGNYEVASQSYKHEKFEEGKTNMKIAVVTEDGTSICQHFGRAPLYVVLTIENGKIINREKREKAGHHTAGANMGSHSCHDEQGRHGTGAAAQATHAGMMANITDCQVLIAGGMGWGAHESLRSYNIEPIITDVETIDEAVKLYMENKLINLQEKLH